MTVAQNMGYGLKLRRVGRAEISERIASLLAILRLEGLGERKVTALSGGQRQRVALGRALLSRPRLLLLDEPLASLDVARREEVLPHLEALRDRLSIPMVYVSHEFDEVLRLVARHPAAALVNS